MKGRSWFVPKRDFLGGGGVSMLLCSLVVLLAASTAMAFEVKVGDKGLWFLDTTVLYITAWHLENLGPSLATTYISNFKKVDLA